MNACTLWIDRLLWWDWSQCCIAHDAAYKLGDITKFAADTALGSCVDAILPGMGLVMFIGVSTPIGLGYWLYARWQARRAA